jgi:hypothetical protein
MLFCVTLCYAMLYRGHAALVLFPATLMLRCLVLCMPCCVMMRLHTMGILWCLMLATGYAACLLYAALCYVCCAVGALLSTLWLHGLCDAIGLVPCAAFGC